MENCKVLIPLGAVEGTECSSLDSTMRAEEREGKERACISYDDFIVGGEEVTEISTRSEEGLHYDVEM